MRILSRNWFSLMVLMCFIPISTLAYELEVKKTNNHTLYVVTLNPNEYEAHVVKGENSVLGRETVTSMAERTNGDVAINAGFFQMGQLQDGFPNGTLLIDGQIYGLKFSPHAILAKKPTGTLHIQTIQPKVTLQLGSKTIDIRHVNYLPINKAPTLFTSVFGTQTLTPYQKRHEIVFNASGEAVEFFKHGNAPIKPHGYVVSLPNTYPLDDLQKKQVKLNIAKPFQREQNLTCVAGLPLLLEHGEIYKPILERTSSFYTSPHARTAIGTKPDGTIVILVAEQSYSLDLSKITLNDINALVQGNEVGSSKTNKRTSNKLTLDELKSIVKEKLKPTSSGVGLTMVELAEWMKKLGCETALNLDGGGSSTLWIKGKVINNTMGDSDEAFGMSVERPVSDAIVFKLNNKR